MFGRKAAQHLRAGVRCVWVVDPEMRTLTNIVPLGSLWF